MEEIPESVISEVMSAAVNPYVSGQTDILHLLD